MARSVLNVLVVVLLGAALLRETTHAQEPCRFVLGFAALREAIGTEKVGTCLEDEHFNDTNGNAEQRTSGGLLVWRKVDNFTAFTDGSHSWVNGPNGLQTRPNEERFSWERDPVSQPAGQTATTTARPGGAPGSPPAAPAVASPVASPAPSSGLPAAGRPGQPPAGSASTAGQPVPAATVPTPTDNPPGMPPPGSTSPAGGLAPAGPVSAPQPGQPIPPTPPPVPPVAQPAAPGQPVTVRGRGRTVTDKVTPPSGVNVVTLTHDGSRGFVVTAVQADRDVLVSAAGSYRGQHFLLGADALTFDVDADGGWTIEITPAQTGGQPTFSGRGDTVSPIFDPPASGPWVFSHDGTRNFIVEIHCAGGDSIVQNANGRVDTSVGVTFPSGPCLWEVEGDGNWRLAPR